MESPFDNLYVGGVAYNGIGAENGPNGVVASDGIIRWVTDQSVSRGGWKVCWDTSPPSPPSPPPSPPSLSPSPHFPPLPMYLTAAAEMCFVVDGRPRDFDALAFSSGIANVLGVFRPYVYAVTKGSCTFRRSPQCSDATAAYYAPEGTLINENRTQIRQAID